MNNKKRVLVTGGTRGIGRAIVKELAANSSDNSLLFNVAFVYHNNDRQAEELIEELHRNNVNIFAFKSDVSSLDQAQTTVNSVIDKFGGIDILINNAGITRDNLLLRMPEKDFDDVINSNLKSVFNYTKAVIKPMITQRYGRIINISSVVGLTGNAGQSNYSASKAGVIGFTKSMARELASRGITVNAIAPGFIQTDMTNKLSEEQVQKLVQNIPLHRIGTPEDIANVVRFLCSNQSDYITGQVIAVDGGMTM